MGAASAIGLVSLATLLFVSRSLAIDCLHAQAQCNQDRTCAVMLMMVPQLCGNSELRTTCEAPDRLQCEGILQILTQTPSLRGCDCDTTATDYAQCQDVYHQLYRQQCTDSEEDAIQDVPTETVKDLFGASPWQYDPDVDEVEPMPSGGSTCIQALDACNGNEDCNKYLLQYLNECRGDPVTKMCRRTECRRSIRSFLDRVSSTYTHALLYCFCAQGDSQCDLVWQGLNAECTDTQTPLPNCLDLERQCSRSALCRKLSCSVWSGCTGRCGTGTVCYTCCSTNFENYKFQCAISDTSGTGCVRSYSACRDARLGMLGTVVAASCTCRGLEGTELDSCKEQQLIVLDNSCFTRASLAYFPSAQNADGAYTTVQPRIVVKKRVDTRPGCEVKLYREGPHIHVPTGHNIRIANEDFADCTQICRCLKSGFLSRCFDVLCNVTLVCPEGHGSSDDCACSRGEQACIDRENDPKDHGKPTMMLVYSTMELGFIHRQLHVTFSIQGIVDKLQQALGSIYRRDPCELDVLAPVSNSSSILHETIVITAHSQTRENWECLNQLNDLTSLISARAPRIATDILLSTIKVAGIIEGAPFRQIDPKTSFSRSCAMSLLSPCLLNSCLIFVSSILIPKLN